MKNPVVVPVTGFILHRYHADITGGVLKEDKTVHNIIGINYGDYASVHEVLLLDSYGPSKVRVTRADVIENTANAALLSFDETLNNAKTTARLMAFDKIFRDNMEFEKWYSYNDLKKMLSCLTVEDDANANVAEAFTAEAWTRHLQTTLQVAESNVYARKWTFIDDGIAHHISSVGASGCVYVETDNHGNYKLVECGCE